MVGKSRCYDDGRYDWRQDTSVLYREKKIAKLVKVHVSHQM